MELFGTLCSAGEQLLELCPWAPQLLGVNSGLLALQGSVCWC